MQMKLERLRSGGGRRGAVILAISLVLTMIAAFGAVLMARTLLDQKRLNERRRDLWRAFHHAEAGIAQIQQWGGYHNQFTPDTTLFEAQIPPGLDVEDLLILSDESRYPVFAALSSDGITVSESQLDSMGIDGFITESGWYLGRITQISILPIDDIQSAVESHLTVDQYTDSNFVSTNSDDDNYAYFKVLSRAIASSGLEREVRAYMKPSPLALISSPGPLISLATASAFGNAKVHWGEAWSKTDFDMLNNSQVSYVLSDPDPLVAWRTEGMFNFPNNWNETATYQANRLHDKTADQPGLFPDGSGDWKDAFYQNVAADSLKFPDFGSKYEAFKKLAKANNRYYTSDAGGNIYRNGQLVDFYQAFTSKDPETPFELAFIDTIDQQPPAADGSNLADINIQGNNDIGDRIRGFYYFAANFKLGGVGSPASFNIENPVTSSDVTLQKIWLDGVIFAAGTLDMDGNAGVYGGILADGGFVGGGTPDVYYNAGLGDGLELELGNLGGPFTIVLQTNYTSDF
jgi:hypothetical protein